MRRARSSEQSIATWLQPKRLLAVSQGFSLCVCAVANIEFQYFSHQGLRNTSF